MQHDTSPFPSVYSSSSVAPPRVVVLTGASSGIGRATALAYARQGNALVLVSRDAATLEAVADDCRAAGGQVLVAPADVSDTAAMHGVAEAAIERFGAIDIWINNVGIGVVGLFDQTPMEAHRRVIEANLIGHMNGAHAVIPHFRERRFGTLINMISIGGWIPTPYAAAYTASKFALRGFSESLRSELSDLPDVHVCEVYPTFVDTPGMTHGANYSGRQLSPPSPLVDPRRIASVLLALGRRPRAATFIGAPAIPGIVAHLLAPNLLGRSMMALMSRELAKAEPAARSDGNLYAASRGTEIDGGYRAAKARKNASIGIAAAGGLVLLAWLATRQKRR